MIARIRNSSAKPDPFSLALRLCVATLTNDKSIGYAITTKIEPRISVQSYQRDRMRFAFFEVGVYHGKSHDIMVPDRLL